MIQIEQTPNPNALKFLPNREVRGKIIKLLIREGRINNQKLFEEIDEDSEKIKKALEGLKKDKLIKFKKNNIIEIN